MSYCNQKDNNKHKECFGKIISGRSNAKEQVADWNTYFYEILGKRFYPGSLNIVMKEPLFLDTNKAIKFADNRYLWVGMVDSEPVYIYRWSSCPLHVIELFSEIKLRDYLKLNDGETVCIKIPYEFVSQSMVIKSIAWGVLWKKREAWYYANQYYFNLTKKFPFKYLRKLSSQG